MTGNDIAIEKLGDNLTDIYESVKNGEKTLDQVAWFNKQKPGYLDSLINNPAKALLPYVSELQKKFELLDYFGTVMIPEDFRESKYFHAETKPWLDDLISKSNVLYYGKPYAPKFDATPGDEVLVRIYRQIAEGTTTTEERMMYLLTQGGTFLGLDGLSIVFDLLRDFIDPGIIYTSFCTRKNSFRDPDNNYVIPSLFLINGRDSDEEDDDKNGQEEDDSFAPKIGVSYMKYDTAWGKDDYLICFTNQDE